jgi:hypothetical protein
MATDRTRDQATKGDSSMSGENGITIEQIQKRLPGAVLIHIPKGEKGPKHKGWQETTLLATQYPTYQKQLRAFSNTGVLLGPPSGSLIAIDFDVEEDVTLFLEDNPAFRNTLRTKGARGCQFWAYIRGNYPERCVKVEDRGEWRGGGGCQSVIRGIHPTGCSYTWLVDADPITITFAEIILPDWLAGEIRKGAAPIPPSDKVRRAGEADTPVVRLCKERTLVQ